MTEPVVLDTGPLVALLSADDAHHQRCHDQLARLHRRPVTCWPVLTEAAWLLRHQPDALSRLLANLSGGVADVMDLPGSSGPWLAAFLVRYRDCKAQLADAALVYLAEARGLDTVFTLDRRDFSIYRTSDGRALQIIPER